MYRNKHIFFFQVQHLEIGTSHPLCVYLYAIWFLNIWTLTLANSLMLQQKLSSQITKFGGTLNIWVVHVQFLFIFFSFYYSTSALWISAQQLYLSISFWWVLIQIVYLYCLLKWVLWGHIWCGIHIHDNRCQKLGLVWRGNQTFEQFLFSIYIYIYIFIINFLLLKIL